MRCISPIKAAYNKDHTAITYKMQEACRDIAPFEFDCRKCLPCRLKQGREKGIRAWHESRMHEDNIFLTLTYKDEHLGNGRLNYEHIQTFLRALRDKHPDKKIPFMVTGEYGDKNQRPHWHLLLFNYAPTDQKEHRTTDLGDTITKSQEIEDLWPYNDSEKVPNEIGQLTMDSASYVARYAAKKLTHGKDKDHDFHPIHHTSKKYALGKTWIAENWKHTFENGFVVLPNGQTASIPRYYQTWLEKNHPDEWTRYVTEIRPQIIAKAEEQQRKEEIEYVSSWMSTYTAHNPRQRAKVKETILKSKFKKLQEQLKL